MRFIHAADLHLDSPLRGLERYQGAPVERARTATRGALERLIDRAVGEPVDFVLLAGDLFDSDWQDFHTGLFFREQMVRLQRAGIRAFVVLGNHDAQGIIARRLSLPDNVTVFASGAADTVQVPELSLAVHGRSFPNRRVDEDWVPAYPQPVPGCFNIGLLHTSLDGRPGHDAYAPTTRTGLAEKGYDYWALGHVHAREVVAERPRIVYPGNPQGRHAQESGAKGCELVSVTDGRIESEFVALDLVRWSQVTLSLQAAHSLEALGEALQGALEPVLRGAADRLHAVRVSLEGAGDLQRLEAAQPGTLTGAIRTAAQQVEDAELWIEQVGLPSWSPLDRGQAAQREDAVGELVRLVDSIVADDPEIRRWARAELGAVWKGLPAEVAGAAGVPRLDDAAALRVLLMDAEATVLARLSPGESE